MAREVRPADLLRAVVLGVDVAFNDPTFRAKVVLLKGIIRPSEVGRIA